MEGLSRPQIEGATNSLNADHAYKSVAPIFDNKPIINSIGDTALEVIKGGLLGTQLPLFKMDISGSIHGDQPVQIMQMKCNKHGITHLPILVNPNS